MVDATGARQPTSEGLSEVLRGERSLDNVAHSEPGSSIAVMSAGRRWNSALSAGESTFAERMFADARRNYDLVVIDGGTITVNSNLEALARRMDVVIFVGTLGNTLQKDLIAANDAAARMGNQDLSVLLVSNPAVAKVS
jgi:polysaccharide biosynthesis transport protein